MATPAHIQPALPGEQRMGSTVAIDGGGTKYTIFVKASSADAQAALGTMGGISLPAGREVNWAYDHLEGGFRITTRRYGTPNIPKAWVDMAENIGRQLSHALRESARKENERERIPYIEVVRA